MLNTLNRAILLMAFAIGILAGCSDGSKTVSRETKVISIDVKNLSDNPGEFFDRWEWVELEKNSEYILDDIACMDIDDDNIVIGSRDMIFLYDRGGKQIDCYDRRGMGPQEYVNISDIKLRRKTIYVLCSQNRKIYTYGLDGKFKTSYTLPEYYANFEFISDSSVLLASERSNNSKYEFARYDLSSNEITEQYISFDQYLNTVYTNFQPFIGQKDGCNYVACLFDYNIYDLSGDSVMSKYRYEFNTPMQFPDFGTDDVNELAKAIRYKEVVKWLGIAYFGEKNIFQTFSLFGEHGNSPYIYKFNPENGEGSLLCLNLKIFSQFPYLTSGPLMIYKDWYVSSMSPATVKYIEEKHDLPPLSPTLDEESNPVLFFHHFKED